MIYFIDFDYTIADTSVCSGIASNNFKDKQKVTYKEFYTVYPITEDDYNDMLNIGIKEIRVDGVKIQYTPMK